MIDVSKVKSDLTKADKYAIKWFNKNGFEGKIVKQYISKTVFEIEKDGVKDKFELPDGIVDIGKYMKAYENNWKMICELKKLRQQVNY